MASFGMIKMLCLVAVIATAFAPYAEAEILCSTVASTLTPCLNYVMYGGPQVPVPSNCCTSIKSLYGVAKTASDRQSVCSCLKTVAASASAASIKNAAGLPGKCGIRIPYKISPSMDCSKYMHLTLPFFLSLTTHTYDVALNFRMKPLRKLVLVW
ncbi:Non-specific lipid-transfer protein 10 [Abeliophyllum distichum]|uniref:Non-specific lipid-transfer protein n=1 Tax=Abeliophyllum distichum TaxID=126358 RepID=A0ABD1RCK7_9LAMI